MIEKVSKPRSFRDFDVVYKSDLPYDVRALCYDYRSSAMRLAVFVPVLGKKSLKDIPGSLAELRLRWRRRLTALSLTQNSPYDNATRTIFARNCPPFGVLTHNRDCRCCGRPLLCPFCWARRVVVPVYDSFRAALFDTRRRRFCVPEGHVLVEFRTTRRVSLTEGQTWCSERLQDALDKSMLLARRRRDSEHIFYGATGGIVLQRPAPVHNNFTFTRAGFLLVPEASMPADRPRVDRELHTFQLTRGDFLTIDALRAIARVCRYPAYVLQAPSRYVLQILRAFRNARMFAARGSWRCKRS